MSKLGFAIARSWGADKLGFARIAQTFGLLCVFIMGFGVQAALAAPSATFTTGAIAEYSSTNANRNDNTKSFTQLGITKIVMTQNGSQWGGTQGNDANVTLTIHFTDTTTYTFTGALNWQLNDGGNAIPVDYFGVIAQTTVSDSNDRYTRTSQTLGKTYILVLPSKVASSGFSTLLSTDATDGSANLNLQDIFIALNAEFPTGDTTAPVVTANQTLSYAENQIAGATIGTVAATDAVGVTQYRFASNSSTTSPDGFYTIDSSGVIRITAAGVLAGVANNDFETTPNQFTLSVQAGDAAGNWSTATNVTLNVTDVNEGPSFTSTNATDANNAPSYSFNYPENSTTSTVLGTVSATDPENGTLTYSITGGNTNNWYTINASGQITLTAAGVASLANDFEQTANSQTLTVTVSDGTNTKAIEVKVNETDVSDNATPSFTNTNATDANNAPSYSFNYAENSTTSTVLGTVSATDPENDTLTFSITGGNTNGWYTINASGQIKLTAAGVASLANDFEQVANSQTLTVTVSDGTSSKSIEVKVNETDVNDNAAPSFTNTNATDANNAPSYSFNYAENSTTSTVLGTVSATDPENGTLTYSITGGNTNSWYTINASGQITLTAAGVASLANDFERTANSQTLTVTVSDGTNTTSIEVKVNETDVDDTPPAISGPSGGSGSPTAELTVNEGQTAVTKLTASEGVTWSITGGNDDGKFQIAPDGTITFVAAPDYENPTDGGTNNTYILTVTATDPFGNLSTQTITVNIANLDDTAPLITGPSNGAGAPESAISVNENQTGVTKMTANEAVTWSISGGADAAKFQIAADGTITFVAAPDYEAPTDAGANNTYVLVVSATDEAGNVSTQTVTVTVLDVDDTGPVITGPSGGAGAAASAISVNENQTGVTKMAADEKVTWSISGGADAAKFQIAADGTITFIAGPDYERPTDGDTNNTYVLVVSATDEAGNVSTQTVTVTVLDLDDTAPVITGPSGGAGAAASAITINEGLTAVTTFTSNEPVTWSIVGGDDAAGFTIDPKTGAISFRAAQDFENPTDADRNNTHIVRIRAVDAAGNVSFQTLTVTIANVDEIARKIAEISGRLRGGLRNYAMHSLGDMLSFNEGLMQGADDADADCGNVQQKKALSGGLNANDTAQQARLGYDKQISQCGRPYRVLVNAGLSFSRFAGDWNSRALGSVRVERKLGSDVTLGLGVMASSSNDKLGTFSDSAISDTSVQLNVYGRARLAEKLRGGAFWGIGKSWYDFELRDDGLDLNGKMSGNRYVYGAMLSGDLVIEGVTFTTDAILSRAVERLGDATLAAAYRGEKRAGIAFGVGSVDTTRLSVPVTGQFVLSDTQATDGRVTKLLISPGLLCEDTSVDASSLDCGYQLGAKLNSRLSDRGAAYLDYKFESVSGLRRNLIGIGYAHQFGPQNALEVAFDVNHGVSEMAGSDNRAMVRLRLTR